MTDIERRRRYRDKNKNRLVEYYREYRIKNKDKIRTNRTNCLIRKEREVASINMGKKRGWFLSLKRNSKKSYKIFERLLSCEMGSVLHDRLVLGSNKCQTKEIKLRKKLGIYEE